MSSRIFTLCLLLLAAALLSSAKPKSSGIDFTAQKPLYFGIDQAVAEDILSGKDWRISFRVDTPSTLEIAGMYNAEIYYRLGFFEGKCYSIEKRIQVPRAEVERVFEFYANKLGETGEATQSEDNSLYFSRWSEGRREISLTADQGRGDIYKLTYEETDILSSGDARRAQQDELGSQPTTVDPITGKPRLLRPGEGEEEGGDESTEGDEKDSKSKGKVKPAKDKKDAEGEEEEAPKEEEEEHHINRDDPNDW